MWGVNLGRARSLFVPAAIIGQPRLCNCRDIHMSTYNGPQKGRLTTVITAEIGQELQCVDVWTEIGLALSPASRRTAEAHGRSLPHGLSVGRDHPDFRPEDDTILKE